MDFKKIITQISIEWISVILGLIILLIVLLGVKIPEI